MRESFHRTKSTPADMEVLNRLNHRSEIEQGTPPGPGQQHSSTILRPSSILFVINEVNNSARSVSIREEGKCTVPLVMTGKYWVNAWVLSLGSSSRWLPYMMYIGVFDLWKTVLNHKVWPYASQDSVAQFYLLSQLVLSRGGQTVLRPIYLQ